VDEQLVFRQDQLDVAVLEYHLLLHQVVVELDTTHLLGVWVYRFKVALRSLLSYKLVVDSKLLSIFRTLLHVFGYWLVSSPVSLLLLSFNSAY
jgi:hypothetical protein